MKFYSEYADFARISDHSLIALQQQITAEERRVEILARCGLESKRPHFKPDLIKEYVRQSGRIR